MQVVVETCDQLDIASSFFTESFRGPLIVGLPAFIWQSVHGAQLIDIPRFMCDIALTSPNLESLTTLFVSTSEPHDWLLSFSNLRSLTVFTTDPTRELLYHSAQLPALEELALSFGYPTPIINEPPWTPSRYAFPRLKRLDLNASEAPFLLGAFPERKIQELKTCSEFGQRDYEGPKFFCERILRLGRISLVSLHLEVETELPASSDPPLLEALWPLTGCLELRDLTIRHNGQMKMDDKSLGRFVERLKKLQTFSVYGIETGDPGRSALSLRSLQSILHHCPDIHSITLCIVGFGEHTLEPVEKQFKNAVSLQFFDPPLQTSEILPIAKHLSNMLSRPPNLIGCKGDEWVMVANLMRVFHRARVSERQNGVE